MSKTKVFKYSTQGHRDYMEDEFFIKKNDDFEFYAIFDGHGGGRVSKYLKKYMYPEFCKIKTWSKRDVNKVFNSINKKMQDRLKSKAMEMGSTTLITLIKKNTIYIINLGDCRVISYGSKIEQLSVDHKPNSKDERKRIKDLGGQIYNDGYEWRVGNLSVSRSFGDLDTAPYISHIPEIFKRKISKNDKIIIMGSDGLFESLSNCNIVQFVKKNLEKNKNIAKQLVEYAIKKGSQDNITAIVILL